MVQHFTVNNHNGKYAGRLYHYDETTKIGREIEVSLTTTDDQHKTVTGYQCKNATEQAPQDFRPNKHARLIAEYGKYWGSDLTGRIRETSLAQTRSGWEIFYNKNVVGQSISKFLTK